MRIIVPIKQVPLVEQLRFDAQSKRIVREGVESEINPFDKRALTYAINLRSARGADRVEVIVLTMGPPQAREALIEALAMGADRAIHLLGREFAGADTLATARALALACQKTGFDLIICGKYSTDAETAQVPPMLAELLNVPQVTGVTRLDIGADAGKLVATREVDDGFESVECALPAVLSAAERLAKPLKVAPGDLEKGRQKPIQVLVAQDLSADLNQFGAAGSPTTVSTIYSIEPTRKQIVRKADDNVDQIVRMVVSDLARGVFELKKDHKQSGPRTRLETARHVAPAQSDPSKAIWVVAELVEGKIRPATLELLGRASELKQALRGRVAAVLMGFGVGQFAKTLCEYGADIVYVADTTALSEYSTERYAFVLSAAIRKYDPYAVLIPSTANGRDLAPRVAARLNVGLTGDCIGLELDDHGQLVQLKPAFGGNIVAPILSRTRPVMATVRAGMLHAAERDTSRALALEPLPVENLDSDRVRVISRERIGEAGILLEDAQIVIGVGMGLGGPEKLGQVTAFADALGARIGATRKVVDAGWLPRQVQIGLTGRSISPRLYIALGISGKFNHVVGIQRATTVLAINNNPEAEIFKQCDYGIVGDWEKVMPAFVQAELEEQIKTAHRGGGA